MPPPCLPAQLPCGHVAGSAAWRQLPCNPLFQPNSLYESLKEEAKAILKGEKAIPEEGKATQEGAQAAQDGALLQVPGPPPTRGWGERTHFLSVAHPAPLACSEPAPRRQNWSSCSLTLPVTMETNVSPNQAQGWR